MENKELLDLLKRMGLTQAGFCKRYKFARKSLYNWTHDINKPSKGSSIRLFLIERAYGEFEEKVDGQRRACSDSK